MLDFQNSSVIAFSSFVTSVALSQGSAIAATITAEAHNDGVLPLVEPLYKGEPIFSPRDIITIEDGDFTTRQNIPGLGPWAFGDGGDEFTTWRFDFTQDSSFLSFDADTKLKSAVLTVERLPIVNSAQGDGIYIQGLPRVTVLPFDPNFKPGSFSTFTLDLLDFYSSEEIMSAFWADNFIDTPLPRPCNGFVCAQGSNIGEIEMGYSDDSVLVSARLELTSTPEPSSVLALMGVGAIAALHRSRRKP
jgi:hypothetical protein